ncbi:Metal-dependent hydrolases of the beta-lactamase superfamily III [[Actinomadura] parvosata subsp. kistnae]|uniref:MBL fold metallo-hydrolase n=1 Tax=[Actinomadura] parvosata subsp. kistnae TaxID=1909395 RepID=A0A1V0A7K4_9ACTN|nr:MBL fold metallo-hydrolase [Nonomuraea sp. ATCC 55076]AQZ66160.1 MBL fold metallo-hydrolase [Nonomuraea sp. ATCC 55076]SPL97664.1 Metal-dependent hydrolases of the beta-lactamase superfamily III [Actinomadura parvosata subsp. kistnae]
MKVTIVGCSGSYPGPDSPASCYLLEADGFRLLLDLGSGSLGALQRHIGLYDVDAICLSHLHADHCLDICGYHVARTYGPAAPYPALPVYAPAGAPARLAAAYGMPEEPGLETAFDFVALTPGSYEIGPFTLTAGLVNHPVEAYGFRVANGSASVAYSGDTGESNELVKLAAGTDLLLCEASFVEGPDLPPGLHLTGRQAAEHAAKADVGKLVLTHLVPWNDQATVLEEALDGGYSGPVELARSGAVYDLT